MATTVAKPVNLNTATAAELDALPQIGPARAKAIVDARAKAKFKNWDDFVARKVVPSNAEAAHQEPGQLLIRNPASMPTDRRRS